MDERRRTRVSKCEAVYLLWRRRRRIRHSMRCFVSQNLLSGLLCRHISDFNHWHHKASHFSVRLIPCKSCCLLNLPPPPPPLPPRLVLSVGVELRGVSLMVMSLCVVCDTKRSQIVLTPPVLSLYLYLCVSLSHSLSLSLFIFLSFSSLLSIFLLLSPSPNLKPNRFYLAEVFVCLLVCVCVC